MGYRQREQMVTALCTIAVIIILIIFIVPTFWMVQTSFRVGKEINSFPPVWWPQRLTLSSYTKLFGGSHEESTIAFGDYFRNSVVATVVSCAVALSLGTMAGYAFARHEFKGKRKLFLAIILMRAIPGLALGMPLLVMFKWVRLVNNVWGLILVYTMVNAPFITWLMEGFFKDIPPDLAEAALIDGCSRLQALLKVDLPLAAPGVAASTIFAFLLSWNEFAIALILTRTPASRTLPVGLFDFVGEFFIDWGGMSAAGTIILIPVVILTFLVQRWIARGLTFGALK
ncbi:MAG: carbohydrate ABC transporter permease [Anaerolineae bacterium]